MNAEPREQVIPGLLSPTIEVLDDDLGEVRRLLAWKRVRPTSAGLYAVLQDTGFLDMRRKRVLNAVAAIRNATQRWPSACEVIEWLYARKRIANTNPNQVRPRLHEMSHGWEELRVTGEGPDGKPTREKVFVPCDILIAGPKRKSDVTGHTVLTWQVREVGA